MNRPPARRVRISTFTLALGGAALAIGCGGASPPKGLTTTFQTAATLRKKLKTGGAFSDTVDEYHPAIDPTEVVTVTYAHGKDAPARQVTMKRGERVVTSEVDEDGMAKTAWSELGKRRLTVERVRVDGHP